MLYKESSKDKERDACAEQPAPLTEIPKTLHPTPYSLQPTR